MPTKITQLPFNEWADTEEKEAKIAEEAAFKAIENHRRTRMANANIEAYHRKMYYQEQNRKYTSDELYKKLRLDFPNFVLDSYNEPIFQMLCIYFTQDEKRALDVKIDLNKGIMLMGKPGVGKTKMMQIFANNQTQSYILQNCKEISDYYFRCKNERREPEENYYGSTTNFGFGNYQQKELGFCFEDLGTDNTDAQFMGNKESVMANIFLARYDRFLISKVITPQMTHITTNLNSDEIEKRYGSRVRDRFREMFNLITFDSKAPSRRK